MLKKELLDVLCCPSDQGDLNYLEEKEILVCKICKKEYKVIDGIPVMLVEDKI